MSATPALAATAAPGRALWPYAVFVLLALAFCAPALAPGRILLPTNPTFFQPWVGDPAVGDPGGPSNGLMGDALIFTLPGRVWNHEMLSRGRIPLWNPYVFAGYPHLGLIQNNALYPLSAPFDAIDPHASLAWSALVHFALAGALMYAFLRRLGLAAAAAAIGGAAFELNGMFLVRVSAPSYVYSGVWLPLVLLGAHAIATAPRLRSAVWVAVGTALSVLGGHPQMTSLVLMLAGTYLVVETTARARPAASRPTAIARAGLVFAAGAALGVGLAGYQVVPFLEMMASSARDVISLDAYRAASLPFPGLLQGLVPDVFGHPADRTYWFSRSAKLIDGIAPRDRFWAVNYSGGNVYTGIAPLVLAAIALWRSERRRETLVFALAAVASLGVLLGSPLLDLAYLAVPGFRYSRPDRVLFVYMGSLAVLSALGFEALERARAAGAPRARYGRQAWAIVALAVVLGVWRVAPRFVDAAARADLVAWLDFARDRWAEHLAFYVRATVVQGAALVACACAASALVRRRAPAAAWVALWLGLLAVPNLLFGWRFNPAQKVPVFGAGATERLLVESAGAGRIARIVTEGPAFLPANVSQLVGLRDVNGASAAGVGDYLGLITAVDPEAVSKQKYFRAFEDPRVAEGTLLEVLGATLVVSTKELPAPYEEIADEGDFLVYRNPRALPRFRVVTSYDLVDGVEEARARVLAPGFDPATHVVLTRPAAGGALPELPAGAFPGTIEVLRDEPEDIHVRARAPSGGILVVSDVFYPGWEARVDGVPVEVLRANAAFRGVVVPPGRHEIELAYRPRSLRIGAAVSALSALAFAALLLAGRRRGAAAASRAVGA